MSWDRIRKDASRTKQYGWVSQQPASNLDAAFLHPTYS